MIHSTISIIFVVCWPYLEARCSPNHSIIFQQDRRRKWGMKAGEWGLWQFIVHDVSATSSSSHSSHALVWDPTHQPFITFSSVGPFQRLQFCKSCSCIHSFHRLQSFMIGVLKHECPMETLPENLLLIEFLSMRCRPCRSFLLCGLPWAEAFFSPGRAGESLLQHLKYLLLFFTDLDFCWIASLTYFIPLFQPLLYGNISPP